jgi:hypothetical protein
LFQQTNPRLCSSPTTPRATTSGSRGAAPSSRCRPPT